MGKLLLCSTSQVDSPYYLENISTNIYSMEELCYYIENYTYLIDSSFMKDELCAWIEQELHLANLAKALRVLIEKGAKLSLFVREILNSSSYLDKEAALLCVQNVAELEGKSEIECNKIRADRLLEQKRYVSSIYEYKKLLPVVDDEDNLLRGSIWYNLGIAYARMFLFEEAESCFAEAYTCNQMKKNVEARLLASLCRGDEKSFHRCAMEYQISEQEKEKIKNFFLAEQEQAEKESIHVRMKEAEFDDYDSIIREWKNEYRGMQ